MAAFFLINPSLRIVDEMKRSEQDGYMKRRLTRSENMARIRSRNTKLRNNVLRDIAADDALASEEWRVLRVWEHEIVHKVENVVHQILRLHDRPAIEYSAEMTSAGKVSETVALYGDSLESHPQSWWNCECGNNAVCVLSVSGPGSLRPRSKKRPASAELVCRECRRTWSVQVPSVPEQQGI
ncbi:MAG: hypothetical protein B6245_20055 [Desulfobacteraceae bacterium 4572_88]|nr:MAG: hypothetical protein B6245_20055 [Desulfobacteraceae bacterium 4572_88]